MKTFLVIVQTWDGFQATRRELRIAANSLAGVERGLNRKRWDDWQILKVIEA